MIRRTLALAVAGVAVAGLTAGAVSLSAAASTDGPRSWPYASTGSSVEPITTGKTLVLLAHTVRSKQVVIGKRFGPGSSLFFEETLKNEKTGAMVGSDSVQCTASLRTFLCSATAFLDGRGTITVYGALKQGAPQRLSVTGGTGQFQNVRGQLTVVDLKSGDSRLTFQLLP